MKSPSQHLYELHGIKPPASNQEAAFEKQLIESVGGAAAFAEEISPLLQRRKTCIHEAAHAVSFWQVGQQIERIAVFKSGGGVCYTHPRRTLDSDFCFCTAAGIAGELRAMNIPAPHHPDLVAYLKVLHRPEFMPGVRTLKDDESDLQSLLKFHMRPHRKPSTLSRRKQRRFWNLAARDVIEADRRLAPDWELVVCLADLLDKIHTLDEAQLQELFSWYTYAKNREAGHA